MTPRISALAGLTLLAFGLTSLPVLASSAMVVKPVHALGGPDTSFPAVLDLGANSKVGVLWCGPKNFDWCLIQFHKKEGWVHTGDLLALTSKGVPLDGPVKTGPDGAPQGGSGDGVRRMFAEPTPPQQITPHPLPGL